MPAFTVRHELRTSDRGFWRLYFDDAFSAEMFRALEFAQWEVVEQREDEDTIVRVVLGRPKLDVPGPIAGLIGPHFWYREEGRFDRKTQVFSFEMKTPLDGKLRTSGSLRCEPRSEISCVRVVELDVEVNLFGLGGMLEAATERVLRQTWGQSAVFINDWLRGHPGAST